MVLRSFNERLWNEPSDGRETPHAIRHARYVLARRTQLMPDGDTDGATLTTTGRPMTATSIQILRIRDGQIVLFRDFADPRIAEEVLGESRAQT